MNRNYTTKEYLQKINLIRLVFPDAKITTDIIVGYPTESDADFNETAEFVKTVKFNSVHIFPYSPRNETAAARLKPITNSIVTQRFNILNNICKETEKNYSGKNNYSCGGNYSAKKIIRQVR
jgi:threonylcarbamoyladenosine tRNA methylthiotransferase MtaB